MSKIFFMFLTIIILHLPCYVTFKHHKYSYTLKLLQKSIFHKYNPNVTSVTLQKKFNMQIYITMSNIR